MPKTSLANDQKSSPANVSRRDFLSGATNFGSFYSSALLFPFPSLSRFMKTDSRISQTPMLDKGFASVRKIGDGLYATISDTSKGFQTVCNGGFLAGKDAALLIEGFISPAGAAFQLDALRTVAQVPVRAALETHHHYDHSFGNAFYGANNIPLWAHPAVSGRIMKNYASMQGAAKTAVLGPLEKAAKEAKTETAKAHREAAVQTLANIYDLANASVLAMPNHPIDLSMLPFKMDLGGLTATIEHYRGHSGTDMIVRILEQNVVYAGDLLFNAYYPVSFDEQATIAGWRKTLKTFASWDKDTIFVPGHGQICGQQEVALFSSMFEEIEEQAQKFYKSGVPAEEAMDLYVIPEKFKRITVFSWDFTIGPTILKLYAEWGAK
jgi:glyoxylase-like metal-dependent hydrolase (beta-lactamase superfamily II)